MASDQQGHRGRYGPHAPAATYVDHAFPSWRRGSRPTPRRAIGPMFDLWSTYLGDQWSVGAWDAMRAAAPGRLPPWMAAFPIGDEPSQDMKEYDPEWARAFWTGTVAASCGTGGAGGTGSGSGRIDVHAHYVPAGYRAALQRAGHDRPDGFPWIPEWSAAEHVAAMDRLGIATSLLSISSPGVHLDGDAAATVALAREVNEDGRRAVAAHPGRFGLLASLPLPDVDAAVAEIAHCCDRLGADGFVLLTNVGGTYVGDPAFEPVWRELGRRRARVLLHPTSPACWECTSLGRPRPMVEFLFDTTRAVVDLVLGGTIARHPDVEVVVPHAGATLPLVADRVRALAGLLADVGPEVDVPRDLGRLQFDLAGAVLPRQLDALLTLTTPDHLHYGSDVPFTPEPVAAAAAERLAPLAGALRSNTARLFPAHA